MTKPRIALVGILLPLVGAMMALAIAWTFVRVALLWSAIHAILSRGPILL